MAQLETGQESRQGKKGKPALYVLIGSVVLAVIVGAIVLTWQNQTPTPDHAVPSRTESQPHPTENADPAKQGSPANPMAPQPNPK